MGAILHDQGCTFRVWAPHADNVRVRFARPGGHDSSTSDLRREQNGYWAADVAGVRAGDEYKFVVSAGGSTIERNDPYARQVTNSAGIGIVVDPHAFDWQDDDFELPPHNELVIYEMHIGSFVAEDGETGRFTAALDRLAHLKRLGVNVIQIMPVAEFAGDRSWGYNPADIFAVESAYGGPEGLKTFVREAHRQGLAVILDVVYNHFGPGDLDLWRFDGWSENDGGGIYFYSDYRGETPWGRTRPDYGRGEVRQFIRDNLMMWLTDYRIDGLRFDMTLYIRSIAGAGGDDIPEGWSLMQWLTNELRSIPGRHIAIAEDLRTVDALTSPVDLGGAGFHAQWDANFVHPVRAAVVATDDVARSMASVCDAIMFNYGGDAFRRVIYSESHDEVANGRARVPHEIAPGDSKGWFAQKRSTLAAALVFTAPGIPMLFQGQEFLQGEWFRDDVPLDWDLRDEFSGIVRLYRDLVRLRLDRGGFTAGLKGQSVRVFHVNDADNVIAFQRWDAHGPGDDVLVVMNFSKDARSNYRIGFPCIGPWRLRFNSDARHYSDDFADGTAGDILAEDEPYDGLDASAPAEIPGYSVLIYSQDRS